MKTENINSRIDGVTKDIRPDDGVVQSYNIPSLGITVEAKSMDEALIKAKAIIKSNK
jgi:hypothetical protein